MSARALGNTMNPKKRKRVAILGFEGAMALDIAGPFDAFSVAAVSSNVTKPQTCYEVVVLGLTKAPFSTESGLKFVPHGSIDEDTSIDTLIVPGGVGLRVPDIQAGVATCIKRVARKVRRIATVCTGVSDSSPRVNQPPRYPSRVNPSFTVTWKCFTLPSTTWPRVAMTSHQPISRTVSLALATAVLIASSVDVSDVPTTSMTL
jgi:DJ-1/PfpI family protein